MLSSQLWAHSGAACIGRVHVHPCPPRLAGAVAAAVAITAVAIGTAVAVAVAAAWSGVRAAAVGVRHLRLQPHRPIPMTMQRQSSAGCHVAWSLMVTLQAPGEGPHAPPQATAPPVPHSLPAPQLTRAAMGSTAQEEVVPMVAVTKKGSRPASRSACMAACSSDGCMSARTRKTGRQACVTQAGASHNEEWL